MNPPTLMITVTEEVKKMCIDTCKEPTRTWKPKRPVETVKVSTNTASMSRNPVSLAPKISSAGKEAPKADLPAYGRGKAAAPAQAKGKVDAPGTTDWAAASAQAREKKEAEERAAVLEHNKKAAERMKAAASAQAKPAASAQGGKAAASAQAKRKAGEESGTLSAVEGRGNVAHRVEESSEDDSEATQDDSDEERASRALRVRNKVFPKAQCRRNDCGKWIKMGDTRLRREEKHWCWGCTSCAGCKVDFFLENVNEVDNKARYRNCKQEIRIIKTTIKLDGEEFTFE